MVGLFLPPLLSISCLSMMATPHSCHMSLGSTLQTYNMLLPACSSHLRHNKHSQRDHRTWTRGHAHHKGPAFTNKYIESAQSSHKKKINTAHRTRSGSNERGRSTDRRKDTLINVIGAY